MTEARSEQVRELLRAGVPIREIARRLGISPTRVHQIGSGARLSVQVRATRRGVLVTSRDAEAEALAERVRRALRLAKIEVEP